MTDQAVRNGTMVPKAEPRREQHKRKPWKNNNNNNNNNRQITSQAPPKRQHTVTAYAAVPISSVAPQKQYVGNFPMCNRCNFTTPAPAENFSAQVARGKGTLPVTARGPP